MTGFPLAPTCGFQRLRGTHVNDRPLCIRNGRAVYFLGGTSSVHWRRRLAASKVVGEGFVSLLKINVMAVGRESERQHPGFPLSENFRKHGVDFLDAISALEDSNRLEEVDTRFEYGEAP
jgi:hypothetical protein